MSERLEKVAELYDAIATELDQAAQHARTAAGHFRDEEVPRGVAHAWAARGHVLEAQERLDVHAREHAGHSNA
jgi:hypothetical protein